MDKLTQFFDHYVINARLKPAFLVLLPLVLTLYSWFPELQNIVGGIVTVLVSFGVLSFLSGWISNSGNHLQDQLFIKWGGAPTTALLKFSDQTLDYHTKQRYHKKLEAMISGLKFPSPKRERAEPQKAEQLYMSAVNFLRENTRNKKQYPMVYSDNVAYGFARNLLAIKWFGVLNSCLAICVNIFYIYFVLNIELINIETLDYKNYLFSCSISILSLMMLFVFIFVINENYVKMRAIRYAKSLLVSCESR